VEHRRVDATVRLVQLVVQRRDEEVGISRRERGSEQRGMRDRCRGCRV